MKKSLFITFEGTDGAGKTTQIQLLKKYLSEKGQEVLLTREPGGTAIGEKLRQIILDKANSEMDDVTEAFLYAASRAQHVAQLIRPALDEGRIVICDRFVDSSVAYQGYGRGLGSCVEEINAIAAAGIKPDLTFLLKLPPKEGKSRILEAEQDRLEQEQVDFYEKVCRGYDELALKEPERIVVINASESIEEIAAKIRDKIDSLLKK